MPYAESSGARIYYDVIDLTAPWVSEPETILFNHGIGIDHRMWTKWIPPLIDRYRLVRLDMRGFGQSTIPAPDAKWSMDLLVGDLMAVARATGAERFHFVGESMGGTVGLCAYFQAARAFRSITVSNGAHIGATLSNLNNWRDVIETKGMSAWSTMMSAHRFYADNLTPAEREWFDAAQQASSAASCLNALNVLRGIDLTSRLSELAIPVLLLHGDSSPFIPVNITAELHTLLPNSELQIFAHARHGLPLSHGTLCAQALRTFLDVRARSPH